MRITRICANIANDDTDKSKLKTQNYKSKVKISTCGHRPEASGRCPKYSLVERQNETIPSIILSLRGAERRSNLLFNLVIASPALLLMIVLKSN